MNTHADKNEENKSKSVSIAYSQMQSGGESTFQFVDNRPESVAQRKLQEMMDNSPQVKQLRVFQKMADSHLQVKPIGEQVLQRFVLSNGTKRNPTYYSSYDKSKKMFANAGLADDYDRKLEEQQKQKAEEPSPTQEAEGAQEAEGVQEAEGPQFPDLAFEHIASFMKPMDQARLAQVSKAAKKGTYKTNTKLQSITSAKKVGGKPMYLQGLGSKTNKVYSPMSPTGSTPQFPHLTVPQPGQPGRPHVSDINNMKLDKHYVDDTEQIGAAEHEKPSRKNRMVQNPDGEDYVRARGNKEPSTFEKDYPVPLTKQEIERKAPAWSGKKVEPIREREEDLK